MAHIGKSIKWEAIDFMMGQNFEFKYQ